MQLPNCNHKKAYKFYSFHNALNRKTSEKLKKVQILEWHINFTKSQSLKDRYLRITNFPHIKSESKSLKVEITGRRANSDLAENYVAGGTRAEVAICNLENDAGTEDALSEVMISGGGR